MFCEEVTRNVLSWRLSFEAEAKEEGGRPLKGGISFLDLVMLRITPESAPWCKI